jgi:hypothetical protein
VQGSPVVQDKIEFRLPFPTDWDAIWDDSTRAVGATAESEISINRIMFDELGRLNVGFRTGWWVGGIGRDAVSMIGRNARNGRGLRLKFRNGHRRKNELSGLKSSDGRAVDRSLQPKFGKIDLCKLL